MLIKGILLQFFRLHDKLPAAIYDPYNFIIGSWHAVIDINLLQNLNEEYTHIIALDAPNNRLIQLN